MEILKRHTILYAEDETLIRLNISKQLKHYFNVVYVAKEGEEAIHLYNTHNPDVVLLDIDLPKLSGMQVAKKIRKENETIPILILTAYTKPTLLLDAIELGICKYLIKPLEREALEEGLQKAAGMLHCHTHNTVKLSNTLLWHPQNKTLCHAGEYVRLTALEKSLMALLVKTKQSHVSHEQIMASVWENKFDVDISIDSVKNLIASLRKKLPKNSIQSIYGKGYGLVI